MIVGSGTCKSLIACLAYPVHANKQLFWAADWPILQGPPLPGVLSTVWTKRSKLKSVRDLYVYLTNSERSAQQGTGKPQTRLREQLITHSDII